jgi:hypothetical protein
MLSIIGDIFDTHDVSGITFIPSSVIGKRGLKLIHGVKRNVRAMKRQTDQRVLEWLQFLKLMKVP